MRNKLKSHLKSQDDCTALKTPVIYEQIESLTVVDGIYVDLYNRTDNFVLPDANRLFVAVFETTKKAGETGKKELFRFCLDKILRENRVLLVKTSDLNWILTQLTELSLKNEGLLESALSLLWAKMEKKICYGMNSASKNKNGLKMEEFGDFCGILAVKAMDIFKGSEIDSFGYGMDEEMMETCEARSLEIRVDFYVFGCLTELYKAFPDKFGAEFLEFFCSVHIIYPKAKKQNNKNLTQHVKLGEIKI